MAHSVDAAPAQAACERWVVEHALGEVLAQANHSDAATQRARAAEWQERCAAQVDLMSVCALRRVWELSPANAAARPEGCPASPCAGGEAETWAPNCLVRCGSVWRDAACPECELPDLGAWSAALGTEHLLRSLRPAAGFQDSAAKAYQNVGSSFGRARGMLLETIDAVQEGAAPAGWCDDLLDYWPDTQHPVGYHPTTACSAGETRVRGFAGWMAASPDGAWQPDARVRNATAASREFGAAHLACDAMAYGAPASELNPLYLNTRWNPATPADAAVAGDHSRDVDFFPQVGVPSVDATDVPLLRDDAILRHSVGLLRGLLRAATQAEQEAADASWPAGVEDSPFGTAGGRTPADACPLPPLRTCASDAQCAAGLACLRTEHGGVCSPAGSCFRHAHCAGEQMCSGGGQCVDPVLAVRNELERAVNMQVFANASSCTKDAGGYSHFQMVPDFAHAHGMCSFRRWFHFLNETDGGRLRGNLLTVGDRVASRTDEPEDALLSELGVLGMLPHPCDRSYQKPNLRMCSAPVVDASKEPLPAYRSFSTRTQAGRGDFRFCDVRSARDEMYGFLAPYQNLVDAESTLRHVPESIRRCREFNLCPQAPFTMLGESRVRRVITTTVAADGSLTGGATREYCWRDGGLCGGAAHLVGECVPPPVGYAATCVPDALVVPLMQAALGSSPLQRASDEGIQAQWTELTQHCPHAFGGDEARFTARAKLLSRTFFGDDAAAREAVTRGAEDLIFDVFGIDAADDYRDELLDDARGERWLELYLERSTCARYLAQRVDAQKRLDIYTHRPAMTAFYVFQGRLAVEVSFAWLWSCAVVADATGRARAWWPPRDATPACPNADALAAWEARTTTTDVSTITTKQALQIAPAVYTATPHAGVFADQLIKDVDALITHALAALALGERSTVRCIAERHGNSVVSPSSVVGFEKLPSQTTQDAYGAFLCCNNEFDSDTVASQSVRDSVRALLLGSDVGSEEWNRLTVEQLLARGVLKQRNILTDHARPDADVLPLLSIAALQVPDQPTSRVFFEEVPNRDELGCGASALQTTAEKLHEAGAGGVPIGTYRGRELLTPAEAQHAVLEYMVNELSNPATMLAEKLHVDDAASLVLMRTAHGAPDLTLAGEYNAFLDQDNFECSGKASDFFRETNPTHRQLRHCVHEMEDDVGARVPAGGEGRVRLDLTAPFLPVFQEVVAGDAFLEGLFAESVVNEQQLADAVCFAGKRGAEVMNPYWAEDYDITTGCDTALNAEGQRFYSSDCRSRFDASDMSFCGGKFPEYEEMVRTRMPEFCAGNDETLVTVKKLGAIRDALQPLCQRAPSTPETCGRAHGTLLRHQGNAVRSLTDTHPVRVLRGLWGADNVVFRQAPGAADGDAGAATALQVDATDIAGHSLHFTVGADGLELECVGLADDGECRLPPRDWLLEIERSWEWEDAFYRKLDGTHSGQAWHCPLQWLSAYAGDGRETAARVPDGRRNQVRFQYITDGRAHPAVGSIRPVENLRPARFLAENLACVALDADAACAGQLHAAVAFNMRVGQDTPQWSAVEMLGAQCDRTLDWPVDKHVLRDDPGVLRGADRPCIVAGRMPKFEIAVLRQSAFSPSAAAQPGAGHACRMGRLPRLAASSSQIQSQMQHCERRNGVLRCLAMTGSANSTLIDVPILPTVPVKRAAAVRARRCDACNDGQPRSRLMSVGRPLALSPERTIAAWLRRKVGPVSTVTWRRRALASNITSLFTMPPSAEADLRVWAEPWVFCDGGSCAGTIPAADWLADPAASCAAAVLASKTNKAQPIHFCLLNAATQALCQSVVQWQEDIANILCRVSGRCATQAFFYSPSVYSTENKEFVKDTVSRFYEHQGVQCPADPYSSPDVYSTAKDRNKCSAWAAEEIKIFISRMRRAGMALIDVLYWGLSIIVNIFELIIDALSGRALGRAFDNLKRSIDMFLLAIEEAARALLSALLYAISRGDSPFRVLFDTLHALCIAWSWWIQNVLKGVICEIWINLGITILRVIAVLADLFAGGSKNVRIAITKLENIAFCNEQFRPCEFLTNETYSVDTTGALPSATRCWTSYTTFVGDPAQLSCTAADTCAVGLLGSETKTCSLCPPGSQTTEQYGCHPLTKTCTCGVPALRDVPCSVSAECAPLVSGSCRYLDRDLSLSTGHVSCDSCEAEPVCIKGMNMELGVCACPLSSSRVATCAAEDFGTTMAVDEALCAFSPENAMTRTFEVQVEEAAAAPCWLLPHRYCMREAGTDNYLVVGMVEQLGVAAGRRLLSSAREVKDIPTLEPLCLDARGGALPNVRKACVLKARESAATVRDLKLNLPACVFCSKEDLFAAVRAQPTEIMRLLTSPRRSVRVVLRHTSLAHATRLAHTLSTSVVKIAQDSPLAFAVVNGSVHVSARKPSWRAAATALQLLATGFEKVSGAGNEEGNEETDDEVNSTHRGPSRALLADTPIWQRWSASAVDALGGVRDTHLAFSKVVSDVFDYNYLDDRAEQQFVWPPRTVASADGRCRVLERLVEAAEDSAAGVRAAQTTPPAVPAAYVRDSWPALVPAPPADAVTFSVLTTWVLDGSTLVLHAVGLSDAVNSTANLLYSAVEVVRESATCDYEAVQTCSKWRVTLLNGIVIVGSWLLVWVLLCYGLNITFVAVLTSPLFLLGLLQLCYGYSWRCIPMLPTCMLEDYNAALRTLLPRQLTIPPSLRQCDGRPCAQACVDVYGFGSWEPPLAWAAADLGLTQTLVDALPVAESLFSMQALENELFLRENIALSGSTADQNAHRICTIWNLHHLLPALVLALAVAVVSAELVRSLLDFALSLVLLAFELLAAAAVRTPRDGRGRQSFVEGE